MKRFLAILCSALLLMPTLPAPVEAAIPVTAVWEFRQDATASNVNGGAFNPSATMATDLACTSATGNAPVCSSASYNFVAGDVGDWLFIQSGTNWTPGWYQVASVAANAATVTATIGAAVQRDATLGYVSHRYYANTVAGIATVASPTGGVWAMDYSQSAAAIATASDLASADGDASPCVVTSATRTFDDADIGNTIHITAAGTTFTVGWYSIASVAAGAATLDRACGVDGANSGGTWYEGGAMSLNSTLDDDLFEVMTATNGTGANRVFVRYSATGYTLGETVSIAATGGTQAPIMIEGYNALRGDTPTTSATKPHFNFGATAMSLATNWEISNIRMTTSSANGLALASSGKAINMTVLNNSTTAGRAAITHSTNTFVISSELISYRGTALVTGASVSTSVGNYIHDSDMCFSASSSAGVTFVGNICASPATRAIHHSTTVTNAQYLNNTFYGAENTTAVGATLATGERNSRWAYNIFYGFTTAVSHADTQSVDYFDYNVFNNNDTNFTNAQGGENDVTTAPAFTNVTQVVVSTATTSNTGNTLTKAGATFTSSGVTAGRDYVYITASGSGTVGIYGISSVDSETQLTLDLAPGNSTGDVTAQITVGRNFLPGAAICTVITFPGALTSTYACKGAVQRDSAVTGGSGRIIP